MNASSSERLALSAVRWPQSTYVPRNLLKRVFILLSRHNDLPWNIRKFVHNKLDQVNFTHRLNYVDPWSKSKWSHTDITRLQEGMVGCQVCEQRRMGTSNTLHCSSRENPFPRFLRPDFLTSRSIYRSSGRMAKKSKSFSPLLCCWVFFLCASG